MLNPAMPDPELVTHDGRLMWRFANGKLLPLIRGGADGDEADDKKFSQADVDRMIQERLARVKPTEPADYAELKAAKVELDKLKVDADAAAAAKLTADEKTAKRIADLEAAVAKSTGDIEAANANALAEKRRSAIVAAAATQKAANPHQVAALLDMEQKHKDAVTIGDDGQVTGAEDAVKAFIEANPHFVGNTTKRPQPDPAQGSKGDAKEFGAGGKAEAARRFGTPAAAGSQQQQ